MEIKGLQLATKIVIDGVGYYLYRHDGDAKGTVIVRDEDANQLVTRRVYPLFEKAREEYRTSVRVVRDWTQVSA